jgi:hypothetical protein
MIAARGRLAVLAACAFFFSLPAFAADAIDIQTSHHSARELQEKVDLEQFAQEI